MVVEQQACGLKIAHEAQNGSVQLALLTAPGSLSRP